MHQTTLFDLAVIAPSRGEARAARATQLREERKAKRAKNESIRFHKRMIREALERERPSVTCCLNWYPPGTSWTHCHTCHKPLYHGR